MQLKKRLQVRAQSSPKPLSKSSSPAPLPLLSGHNLAPTPMCSASNIAASHPDFPFWLMSIDQSALLLAQRSGEF